MRELCNSLILFLYFLVSSAFANETLNADQIIHDPFEMPVLQQITEPENNVIKAPDQAPRIQIRLFSTLRACKNSMANVSGRILKVGETIDGYTLIAVHERSVDMLKNQQRTHLTFDDRRPSLQSVEGRHRNPLLLWRQPAQS